jgi:hypothetical protein
MMMVQKQGALRPIIFKPETVIGWQRAGARIFWLEVPPSRWTSRKGCCPYSHAEGDFQLLVQAEPDRIGHLIER